MTHWDKFFIMTMMRYIIKHTDMKAGIKTHYNQPQH